MPVQFHQVLSVLDSPTRASLRGGLHTLATGLGDGGADGLRTLAPELSPLLRNTAWAAEALRGTRPDDIPQLVRSTNRLAVALDDRPEQLGSLLDNLATTAGAVQSRDRELSASLAGLSQVLRVTPAGAALAGPGAAQARARGPRGGARAARGAPGVPPDATVIGELDRLAAPSGEDAR